MCMSGQYIPFTIFEEIIIHHSFSVFIDEQFWLIGKLQAIFGQKYQKYLEVFPYKMNESHTVCMIEHRLFWKYFIPILEIFSISLLVSDFFEERISLPHNGFIVSLYFWKLSESTWKNRVYIITSNRRRKIEKVHIKRGEKYCSMGKIFSVFNIGNFPSLNTTFLTSLISCDTKSFWTDRIIHREFKIIKFLSWCLKVVKVSSWCQMDRFENMRLSWTVGSNNSGSLWNS